MTSRPALVRLLIVVGIVGCGTTSTPSWSQDREGEPTRGGKDAERRHFLVRATSESGFLLWRQKARLELEVLQAQVEAKKAEILLREAEQRARRLEPDIMILTKLEQRVRMAFPDQTPLEDVLKYVKSASQGPNDNGIPIYVDPVGLQKAGKTMTSPIAIDLEDVPLHTTLRLVLKQIGLKYTVEGGLLTITADSDH